MEDYVRQRDNVLDYIDSNLSKEMTLEELAAVSCYSKYHFSRIFTAMLGETVFHYIHRLRLERAAKWMRLEEDTPITNIAYELGFSSCATFSRCFKEHFGSSPSAWRNEQSKLKKLEREKQAAAILPINNSDRNIFFDDKNMSWQYEILGRTRVQVQIRDLRDITIVYLRYIGASLGSHQRFEYTYETLLQWASARGLSNSIGTKIFAVYHDNPLITDESQLRISAGFEAAPTLAVSGKVGKMVLAGGKYAVAQFEYETREEYSAAYNFIYEFWLSNFSYSPDIHRHDYICFLNRPSEKRLIVTLSVPIRSV